MKSQLNIGRISVLWDGLDPTLKGATIQLVKPSQADRTLTEQMIAEDLESYLAHGDPTWALSPGQESYWRKSWNALWIFVNALARNYGVDFSYAGFAKPGRIFEPLPPELNIRY